MATWFLFANQPCMISFSGLLGSIELTLTVSINFSRASDLKVYSLEWSCMGDSFWGTWGKIEVGHDWGLGGWGGPVATCEKINIRLYWNCHWVFKFFYIESHQIERRVILKNNFFKFKKFFKKLEIVMWTYIRSTRSIRYVYTTLEWWNYIYNSITQNTLFCILVSIITHENNQTLLSLFVLNWKFHSWIKFFLKNMENMNSKQLNGAIGVWGCLSNPIKWKCHK